MIKLAFFVIFPKPIDFRMVLVENPGIGGAEFCFALLIMKMNELFSSEIEITVFSNYKHEIPDNIRQEQVDSLSLTLDKVDGNFSFLIMKTLLVPDDYNLLSKYSNLNVICWSHNYFNARIAKLIAKSKQIVANVFVGKQMYDFYYDNDVIGKSTYIYNPVPKKEMLNREDYVPYSLTYMGAIIEDKGIMDLLKVWKIVEKKYPDAILNIIGNISLYSLGSVRLGAFGITEECLERKMLPYIIDKETNQIKDTIRFLGILSDEKYDVFMKSAVGIVNPSAKTETFGMGIIEMASVGLPVVTRAWNGHLDTVIDGETGLLSLTTKGIAKNIIKLFSDRELNLEIGRKAKERVDVYNLEKIALEWFTLINKIKSGDKLFKLLPLSKPYWNNYKFLRYVFFLLRFKCNCRFFPSVVTIETIGNDISKCIKRHMRH